MPLTASKLQTDTYQILDQIIETGVPVEIEHHGKILKILFDRSPKSLDNLEKRDFLRGDPEDIVHMDWSKEWQP